MPIFRIKFPENIAREERRRFVRVRPSEKEPVYMQFVLADKRTVTVEAMDISGGGIACVLPNNLAKFKTGNSFHMAITLPIVRRNPGLGDRSEYGPSFQYGPHQHGLFDHVRTSAWPCHVLCDNKGTGNKTGVPKRSTRPSSFGKAEICLIEKERHHDKYAIS